MTNDNIEKITEILFLPMFTILEKTIIETREKWKKLKKKCSETNDEEKCVKRYKKINKLLKKQIDSVRKMQKELAEAAKEQDESKVESVLQELEVLKQDVSRTEEKARSFKEKFKIED